jgi:hypothetical protein
VEARANICKCSFWFNLTRAISRLLERLTVSQERVSQTVQSVTQEVESPYILLFD